MLIPYNSDAPLYHPPYATVGLIIANVLLFFAWPPYDPYFHYLRGQSSAEVSADFEELESALQPLEPWADWRMLHLGNGVRPWQWVTANFIHKSIFHLIANLVFLWGIGLVIEGKLGWQRFLIVYLLIGAASYGIVQLLGLWSFGEVCGASPAIYGLMILALIWAPLNNLSCFLMIGFRPTPWDVPIATFAGVYLALQVVFFFIFGMEFNSEVFHLIGALVAAPIGWYMLTHKMVDCEDYDVISVLKGRHELTRDERREIDEAQPEFKAKVANQQQAYVEQINAILKDQRDPALAWAAHLKATHRFAEWHLPVPTERTIIDLFLQQGKLDEALPAINDYFRRSTPEQSADLRIKLAERMIGQAERPRQGIKLLAPLGKLSLNYYQKLQREKLLALAEAKKSEIEIEEPTEDW